MSKTKTPAKPIAQIKAFKETARALECDESEDAFDKALGKIGKALRPNEKITPKR